MSASDAKIPRLSERTRLAPSPTGALHLGNARTFLVNWALARQRGWRVLLRIEDLDTPRVKAGAEQATVDILRWLGLDWDEDPVVQSTDLVPYRAAIRCLARSARAYPSDLTRSEIEAAVSAPQEGGHETPFPASLRPDLLAREFERDDTNWRFATLPGPVEFTDGFAGRCSLDPATTIGDFVVWTKRGHPSYQLAVVVDDHRQGVTQIVRGDDLLDSAARQLLIYRALGHKPEPSYTHLPLVRGPDGRRLAKRHGDTRIESYRSAGVRPERLVGLLAHWCGFPGEPREITPGDFAAALDLARVPRKDVVFTPEHHAWLVAKA